MLISVIFGYIGLNLKPLNYLAIKNIKNYYYNNLLTYDIYKDEKIINTRLLTAEHIFPKSYSKEYSNAKKDMHNIFLTDAETNIYRSNYPFSNKVEYQNMEMTNFYKLYHPCNFAKGQIARTIAYMKIIYPNLEIKNVIDIDLIIEWNLLFQPNEIEIRRNNLIYEVQGNKNIFIEDPLNIYKYF